MKNDEIRLYISIIWWNKSRTLKSVLLWEKKKNKHKIMQCDPKISVLMQWKRYSQGFKLLFVFYFSFEYSMVESAQENVKKIQFLHWFQLKEKCSLSFFAFSPRCIFKMETTVRSSILIPFGMSPLLFLWVFFLHSKLCFLFAWFHNILTYLIILLSSVPSKWHFLS